MLPIAAALGQPPPDSGSASTGLALVVVEATGLTAGERQVAEALLRVQLDNAGIGDLYGIRAEITRIDGGALIVALSTVRQDGQVHRRLEAVAADLDDLHPVFERMARAIAGDVPLSAIATRPEVWRSSAPTRPRTERYFGAKVGAWGPAALGWGMDLCIAYSQREQRIDRFFDWSVGFALPLPNDPTVFAMVYSDLGWAYIFGEAAFGPYLGGGFGVRIGGYDTFSPGAGVFAIGGFVVDRSARATVYVQARASLDGFAGGDTHGSYPALVMGGETGIGF